MACWLWICGLAWCSRHLTDGVIPAEAVSTFGVPNVKQAAESLVRVNLWGTTANGYIIHDYLEFQPSAEQVKHRRERTADRVANWKVTHGRIGHNGNSNAVSNAVSHAVTTPAPVPVPVPDPQIHVRTRTRAQPARARSSNVLSEVFEGFWTAYPRKVGKGAAWKIWCALNPSQDIISMMGEALAWQIHQPQWTKDSGQFIPHPATWLRQKRWTDERPPTSGARL